MRIPKWRSLVAVCILAPVAIRGLALGKETATPKRPNVLFILTDDQRWDTIHALGNAEIKTPNLDRLVESGFVFNNAYCMGSMVGAVCRPSRTMLMTGRSLWRLPRAKGGKVGPEVPLLPRVMNNAGYVTFRTGKRGNTCQYANAEFDYNTSNNNRGPYSSKEHADRAIKFLGDHQGGQPFFMYLAFAKPHDPRTAPEEYMKMYNPEKVPLPKNFLPEHPFDNGELRIRDEKLAPFPRPPEVIRRHIADYYATITYLDFQIGRIIETLKARGYADNTLIVFSSDQGLAVGRHGLMGKQNLYEHVKPPLVFAGPGIPQGKSDALVYLFDLFPTFCELTGLEIPDALEGQSLVPIINGEEQKVRDFLFAAYKGCQRMIRDQRWKLIKYNAAGVKNRQLFDLANDPWELNNLADDPAYGQHLTRLEKLLKTARNQFGDPIDFEADRPVRE